MRVLEVLLSFSMKSGAKSLTTSVEGLLEVSGERKCELVMLETGEEWIRECSMATSMLQGGPSEMGGREVKVRTS